MDYTLEIQKEFEILVEELKRLKNINEITSANANSAEAVINEVDRFAKSISQFKSLIDKDFEQKNKKIEQLLNQLSDSFKHLDEKTQNNSEKLTQNLKILHEQSDNELRKNQEYLKVEIISFIEQISKLNDTIKTDIDLFSKNAIQNISERESVLLSQLTKIEESTKELSSVIVSKISDKIDSYYKETYYAVKYNESQIKKNNWILIISTIIIIGLIIGLYLK